MANIAQIIRYEGDNSTFIWKHPCEDFNTMTQLIVHEGQEALFFRDGEALDLFGPGRYTLETQNIPLIGRSLRGATGGKTPFTCQVYFINTTVHMSVKWGTDSKVRFLEPETQVPLELGASGEMNLAVADGRKLLSKLVGAMGGIAWNLEGAGFARSLQSAFRPMISTAVKTHLADSITRRNINILDIDRYLEDLSQELRSHIEPGFLAYGLAVPQFYVNNVVLPEEDPNFRLIRRLHTVTLQTKTAEAEAVIKTSQAEAEAAIETARRKAVLEKQTTETEIARRQAERELIRAQAEAQAKRMDGMAEAEVMRAQGYNQRDVLQAEVQKAYAEGLGNMQITGAGGVAGDMVGLGVGLAAAGAVGSRVSDMFRGMEPQNAPSATCAKCGSPLPEGAKFCLECGEKMVEAGMVICPACGKTVARGKFCLECGHKFVTTCPKCGNTLPEGAKFCLECGEKL